MYSSIVSNSFEWLETAFQKLSCVCVCCTRSFVSLCDGRCFRNSPVHHVATYISVGWWSALPHVILMRLSVSAWQPCLVNQGTVKLWIKKAQRLMICWRNNYVRNNAQIHVKKCRIYIIDWRKRIQIFLILYYFTGTFPYLPLRKGGLCDPRHTHWDCASE